MSEWFEHAPQDLVVKVDGGRSSRGLGFLLNAEYVLASVGPGRAMETTVSRIGLESMRASVVSVIQAPEPLVVLRLDEPGSPLRPFAYGQAIPGEPFDSVAVLENDVLAPLPGTLADDATGTLDGPLPQVRFIRGAPVLQRGVVTGIVTGVTKRGLLIRPLSLLVDQLDPFAPEIRDGVHPVEGPLSREEFSLSAWRTLCWYQSVLQETKTASPRSAFWIAVLLAQRRNRSPFAAAVRAHLAAVDISLPNLEMAEVPNSLAAAHLGPLVQRARFVRARVTGDGPLRMRHLVTAVLTTWPDGLVELGGDPDKLRERLVEVARTRLRDDDQLAWQEVLGWSPRPVAATWAGFDNDSPDVEQDELDVEVDVRTLCSVLAAKDAVPPMAVGLFGRWGAGKSTFMKLMRNRMDLLAATAQSAHARNEATAYCSDIVQIEFNAWHYMDANLWASLAVCIFQGLAAGTGVQHGRDEAGELLAELHEREHELSPVDVKISAAVQDPRLKDVAERLGLEANRQQVIKALGQVSTLRRFARAMRLALFDPRWWVSHRRRVALVLVGSVLALSAGILVASNANWLLTAAPAVAALFGAVARFVSPALKAISTVNDVLARASLTPAEIDTRVKGDRKIAEIKQRLARIDRQQDFYDFVLERAGSDDYRRHFGLISVVRDDFEMLAKRMAADTPNRRIVLYIDDLDRCPPDRVVEVLQAVHLLLAFRLFVVVVGVDPRWLVRSLERQYSTVISSDGVAGGTEADRVRGDEAFRQSTPQNYLEKIFQIPFALRSMDIRGFGRLVDRMFEPDITEEGPAGQSETAPSGAPSAAGGPRLTEQQQQMNLPRGPESQRADTASSTPRPAVTAAYPVDPNPAALRVTSGEIEFMRSVGSLVQTPREAKRLFNLYRLVRASRAPEDLDRFVADGEYTAVITLLAVLVGFRQQGRELFSALASAPSDTKSSASGSWAKLAQACQGSGKDAEAWAVLCDELLRLDTEEPTPNAPVEHYRRWVSVVERYSFDTALATVAPPAKAPATSAIRPRPRGPAASR